LFSRTLTPNDYPHDASLLIVALLRRLGDFLDLLHITLTRTEKDDAISWPTQR
jgi:hypothetical protein